ncbi:MAG: hypothetical protein LBG88_00435 [Christensenellaceae bacterium]|jgi:uncharacterized membrane protein YuzA (DUF378 family)|nr:hypothetical protein [Christensenellaceae bacterium]
MFIPIGGVFVFGDGASPMATIITALFNLVMGGLALLFGYMYDFTFFIVLGYVVAGLGALMLLLNLFKSKSRRQEK